MSLKSKFGIDYHVGFTLLLRFWAILSGAVTTLFVTRCLFPADQGYYYTMVSILAVQVFFELGLNQVVVSLVSHEAAKLVVDNSGCIDGDLPSLSRLKGLFTFLRRWYLFASCLFLIFGGLIGFLFIQQSGNTYAIDRWVFVWISVVILNSINLFLSPELAFIEAVGKVGQVAKMRIAQLILGSVIQWVLMLNGGNLWTILPVPFVSVIITITWLSAFRCRIADCVPAAPVFWRQNILPLQWRIGLSWISGYCIFSLFTPVTFRFHGPVEAGRIGVAISIFSAITGLGLSWINAHLPTLTKNISLGQTRQLNQLFDAVALRAVSTTAFISVAFLGLVIFCEEYSVNAVKRIAPSRVLIWIGIAAVLNTIIHAAATYMRAHRQEPMLKVSVASAVAVGLVLFLFRHDISAMMVGYAFVVAFITLPWSVCLFLRYRFRGKM